MPGVRIIVHYNIFKLARAYEQRTKTEDSLVRECISRLLECIPFTTIQKGNKKKVDIQLFFLCKRSHLSRSLNSMQTQHYYGIKYK